MPVESLHLEVCADQYAAEAAPFFATSPISSDTNLDLNTIKVWQTELCVFAEAKSNPFVRTRTPREIQDAGHLLEVTRFLKGAEQGTLGDALIDRAPGPIYILDQGQPVRTVLSQFKVEQCFVPKALLGLSLADPTTEIIVPATHPTGFLLHTCMSEIYGLLRDGSIAIPMALFERFLALLKANMGVHPQREDVRRQLRHALFEQICVFIERNLGDPALSTHALLQTFGVSRASLYRMFESHGGVRTYIMQRRVARAVLEIEENSIAPGRLRQAAERWGFSSQPNFNRKIRDLFGTNPGNLFAGRGAPNVAPDAVGRILADFTARTAIVA